MDEKPSADDIVSVFKALSQKKRLDIVLSLIEKPLCVNDIACSVGVNPTNISHHLHIMESCKVVVRTYDPPFVFYKINDNIKPWVIKLLSNVYYPEKKERKDF